MGQYHVLVYAELPDVDLVGVVDIDHDRAKAIAARLRHARLRRPPRADRPGRRGQRGGADRAALPRRPRSAGGRHQRARREADDAHARGGARAVRGRPAQRGHPARRPRRALQRRGGGAQADRDRAHPHRVAPAGSVRAARAEGHRGDGPHDPRHRHRPGAGGFAARAAGRPGVLGAHRGRRRGHRADPLRLAARSRRSPPAGPPRRRSARWPSPSPTPTSCSTTPSRTSTSTAGPPRSTR